MKNSSILYFKRAKSIDSNAAEEDFKETDKVLLFQENNHQFRKLFCYHSYEKSGRKFISINEFLKMMTNLKVTPLLIKTYTLKRLIECIINRKQIHFLGKFINGSSLSIGYEVFKMLILKIMETCYNTDVNISFKSFLDHIKQSCLAYYSICLNTPIKKKNGNLGIISAKHRKSVSSIIPNLSGYTKKLIEQNSSSPKTPIILSNHSNVKIKRFKSLDDCDHTDKKSFLFTDLHHKQSGFLSTTQPFAIDKFTPERCKTRKIHLYMYNPLRHKAKQYKDQYDNLYPYDKSSEKSENLNTKHNSQYHIKRQSSKLNIFKKKQSKWYTNLSITKHISISLCDDT